MVNFLLFAILAVSGCQSTKKQQGLVNELLVPSEDKSLSMLLGDNCPAGRYDCQENYDPTQCYVKKYQDREFLPWKMPVEWGDNQCLTLEKLHKRICQLRLDPRWVQVIQCIPDVSRSLCAADYAMCNRTLSDPDQGKPYYCVASSYQGRILSSEQRLVGWGMGRCDALKNLKEHTCRINLNPLSLGEINCNVEPRLAECTRKTGECRDQTKITSCRGVLKNEKLKVEAKADSECAAREAIAFQACQFRHPPSDLKNVKCSKI